MLLEPLLWDVMLDCNVNSYYRAIGIYTGQRDCGYQKQR